MKISRDELQAYFKAPLPSTADIAEAFTFHCFEIEEIAGDVLDIKVLPDRTADCSSAEGIAIELSSILDVPLKNESVITLSGKTVEVSLGRINAILGTDFSEKELEDVFRRLYFHVEKTGEIFRIAPRAARTDIQIPEDIAGEVARILGYELVPATELPASADAPDQARFNGIERMKDMLVAEGFSEVSTQTFAPDGDVLLLNPLDKTKPALRTSLEEGLQQALETADRYAPLIIPPQVKPKLFEVGTVFPKEGEYMELRMTEKVPEWGENAATVDNLSIAKLEEYGTGYTPVQHTLGAYKPFSIYPFVTRDLAVWVPATLSAEEIQNTIQENAGALLVRIDQFDQFAKEEKVSYAFRLVFQSMERTLVDTDVTAVMEKITGMLATKGYEVR